MRSMQPYVSWDPDCLSDAQGGFWSYVVLSMEGGNSMKLGIVLASTDGAELNDASKSSLELSYAHVA